MRTVTLLGLSEAPRPLEVPQDAVTIPQEK